MTNGQLKVRKVEVDQDFITRGDNTIKLVRFVRCKNENLHAALKQKFQILNSVIDLDFLDPLFHGPGSTSVSKYTAIISICCGLYNQEHAGFPVNFLSEDQKIPKAIQVLQNLNHENLLQHIDVETLGQWTDVSADDFDQQFDFPKLNGETFRQIYEITSSVHALVRGNSIGSHIRKIEVDRTDVSNFEEYAELLEQNPQELRIQFKRIEQAPSEYTEKEQAGILPAWPGAGTLFRLVCYPSNRSDIRSNCKMPSIFVLDDREKNPLNCSDVFKPIGAMRCYNCPSLNGSIGNCAHLGFMIMLLSAPFALGSTSRPVQLVNMKNKFSFLDPNSVTDTVNTHANALRTVPRRSTDRRKSSIYYFPEENMLEEETGSLQDEGNHSVIGSLLASPILVTPFPRNSSGNDEQVSSRPLGQSLPPCEQDQPCHRDATSNSNLQGNDQQPYQGSSIANSQASSSQSLFGFGRTDIDAFIRRRVRRNPSRSIPLAHHQRGYLYRLYTT